MQQRLRRTEFGPLARERRRKGKRQRIGQMQRIERDIAEIRLRRRDAKQDRKLMIGLRELRRERRQRRTGLREQRALGAHIELRDTACGELRAKKRSAQAAYDAALADYQQTVLQALQQVADTLTALQNDAHELQARDDAAQQAQASLNIAHARYSAGGVSQFGLLDTQRQALQTALDRTRAQADRLADTAALFQALGGVMSKPADAGL